MAEDNTTDNAVRVSTADAYGHAATGKPVQFPGQIGMAPRAHVPGQPVYRVNSVVSGIAGNTGTSLLPRDATPLELGQVEYQQLHASAQPPQLGSATAAGYDLVTPEAVSFKPGERKTIPLGFALALPPLLHGRIESRSGLALRGMVVLTGVIDADYRGEVKVIMQNFSSEAQEFAAGDRVAQMVLRHTVHVPFTTVEALAPTARGSGGFGSTGR